MKNKNIRKRLWCLLAACVSFVPSSKAMKMETSVDSSGYEASDEASGDDYKDFVSKLNKSKKEKKPRKKKVLTQTTEEEVKRPTFLRLLSRIDKLDLAFIGLPTLWWLTGGRPVTTGWNKFRHNVDFFDSKYRKVMFRDVQGLNVPSLPSLGHNVSVGDTFVKSFGPAPILKEEEKVKGGNWKAIIKSKFKGMKKSVKGGLVATKNFITRKTKEELAKEEAENKQLKKDSKNGTFFVSCNGDTQTVNFENEELKESKDGKINKIIIYAQCNDVFIADIPENIKYLTVVGGNNVSISSDLTNLKYFEVHCGNLYFSPPYDIEEDKKDKKDKIEVTKLKNEENGNLIEAVLDIRGLFSLGAKKFNGLWNGINKKKKLELDYGFKKSLTINRNGENDLPGLGKLTGFKVTGSLAEGNWLKLQKIEKKNEEDN